VKPFIAAINAGTSSIMPYYSAPKGKEFEEVGFSFNKAIIDDLLRKKLGFKGIINSDTGPIEMMPWGVESLSIEQRYVKAIEAGVDIVDGALGAMSGLTSQPNLNSLVAMMQGHAKASDLDLDLLNEYSNYWEAVRTMYTPFESELKAGTAEVYNNEIPGGQYTNLRGQAIALGVGDKFEQLKRNYTEANTLFGDIVKVTPSSKVGLVDDRTQRTVPSFL
jgi:pyruvate carboxylase